MAAQPIPYDVKVRNPNNTTAPLGSIPVALYGITSSGEVEVVEGPPGPRGEKGEKGDRGDTGATGATGTRGPAGVQGERGPAGPQGERGPAGDVTEVQGPQGEIGPQGPQGVPGATGDKGDKGDKGDPGDTGPKGDTGERGETGPQGPQGIQGIPGSDGAQGERGPQGDTGPRGETGARGEQGIQGVQGPKGDMGATGATGATGSTGPGIAAGGTSGQVLVKTGTGISDTAWRNPPVPTNREVGAIERTWGSLPTNGNRAEITIGGGIGFGLIRSSAGSRIVPNVRAGTDAGGPEVIINYERGPVSLSERVTLTRFGSGPDWDPTLSAASGHFTSVFRVIIVSTAETWEGGFTLDASNTVYVWAQRIR